MRDAADTLTLDLPGLPPAGPRPRARAGMVVWCDGIACRVATVMRGAHVVELRTLRDGNLIGLRPVAEVVFDAHTSMDAHRRASGQPAAPGRRIAAA